MAGRDDQGDVIEFLSRREAYGRPGDTVTRIDTHASVVFLVGDRAYKLKRAIRFSYLDYSTVAKREAMCRAEYALNRRTAPDLYLGVHKVTRDGGGALALDGAGVAVDWVLEMKQFPQEALFDRMAERHELTPPLMRDLADEIAAFHAHADACEGGAVADTARESLDNLHRTDAALDQRKVAELAARTAAALARLAPALAARPARRCHGDLHLRNIALIDGKPVLFDGIEFNDAFICIDPLYDLAFLLMDLGHRDLGALANIVFNRYLDRTGDEAGLVLLPLYLSIRAGVRAHVSIAALERQNSDGEKRDLAAAAARYLDAALAFLEPAQPRLVATGGFSGTGKSTVAQVLAADFAPKPGARVLRSDVIRKRLFGVAPETRLPSSAYDKATNERVYRTVYDEAAAALDAGYSAIADAAFLDPAERAAIAAVATRAGVPFTGLWLEARAETLRQRIAARRGDASDADRAVLDFQLSRDLGPLDWARVDASGSIKSVTAAAGRYLFSGGVPLESGPMRGDKSSAGAAPRPRPVVLCILDGWGHRRERADNAIALAKAPNWHRFLRDCPHALLEASETFVGLPSGQMGNSEVGHMNLGAGRVVMQDLPRIDQAVADGSLAKNKALTDFVAKLKKSGGTAHLLGLLSPGGVHSHQDHIAALAKALDAAGVTTVCHAFLDGRDTPPKSALGFIERFEGATKGLKHFRFGTIGGRYYGMDRDTRWDREQQAYDAMVAATGDRAHDAKSAIEAAYARGEGDEFVKPTVIGDYAGMKDGDGLVSANFRADRIRQILMALLDPKFDAFKRGKVVKFAAALGMTQYSDELDPLLATLFPPQRPDETFGQIVSEAGLKQLRIAETEKYAHVTFFFNGGREEKFPGETRILVPSPKVKTYDLKPEMSANEVTDKLVDAIDKGRFDAIVCNFANADMVGHTGDEAAAIEAVETVDRCLGRIATAVKRAGGCLLITADHGNAELMRDPETHEPHTAHTLNPVPAILVNGPPGVTNLENGRLADIAPTLLALMGLTQPKAMTGHPLFHAAHANATV